MSKVTNIAIRLELPCSGWLTLSLMLFGVMDAQSRRGQRVLTLPEMLVLNGIGGKLKKFMLNQPTFSWHGSAVPFDQLEVSVILKIIRWYEDSLLAHGEEIENKLGVNELTARYEKLTQITRALQTAPTIASDQLDS